MKRLLNIILTTFTVLIISSCSGQDDLISVQIKLLDEKKVGLPEATIKIENSDTSLIQKTNFDGNIQIRGLKPGAYKIDASSIGYYNLKDYPIELTSKDEMINVEMIEVKLNSVNVQYDGGWVTFEDKNGNIKSIRTKGK